MNKIKVLDLFAGCGGFSCGFEMTDKFVISSAVEFNKSAANTYLKNHQDTQMVCEDIRTLDPSMFSNKGIDVIIGGPPCQGFSVAGKRREDDERNLLPFEYIRFVKTIKPKIFVMENVKGLLSMNNGKIFADIIQELGTLGYNISYKVLNTNDYLVPQIRERVFVVGVRQDLNRNFSFPEPQTTHPVLSDAIGDIIKTGSYEETHLYNHDNVNFVDKDLYYKLGQGKFLCDVRHGETHIHSWDISLKGRCSIREKKILNAISKNRRKKIYGPKDGNPLSTETIKTLSELSNIEPELTHLTELEYLSKIDDKYDIHDRKINMGLRIFDGSKPINTITTQSGEHSAYAHYSEPRNLTVRELARIQTFPDNFIFTGTIKEQETQIGNAVPPLMAKALAEKIVEIL